MGAKGGNLLEWTTLDPACLRVSKVGDKLAVSVYDAPRPG